MKTALLLRAAALAALVALVPLAGRAQVYNTNSPVYIPTAVLATTTLKTTGDVYFQTQNTNAVSVQLLGSHGSLVAAVQGTNQGADVSNANATWTALTMLPVPSGAGVASVTANGFWYVNASGMTRVRVHVSTMASGTLTVNVAGTTVPAGVILGDGTTSVIVKAASTSAIATDSALVVTQSPNVVDPCMSPMVAKSSAVINVTSSSTTKIVDTSASTVVYVCGFSATLSGTTPTATFTSGTHVSADCDTGAAVKTGTFAPVAGGLLHAGYGNSTVFKSAAGAQVCVTTGATSTIEGVLTYVQQ